VVGHVHDPLLSGYQVIYTDPVLDWAQRRRSTGQRTRRLIHQLEQLDRTVTIAAAT
jgi:hypothetical protein